MKVLEVNTLQSGIDKVKNDLNIQEKQLQQIAQSIQAIVDLRDSFKGEGGQAIRGFYESYHLLFLKELLSFYGAYIETLSQMKLNLDLLEPNNNGFIRESFLEYEVSDGLKMIKERTMSLTEEANSIMSGVSDIVSLPKLDDSYVLQGITQADQKRDLTIGLLHTYDQQQTSALLPLEHNVQAMIQYIQLVSTLFQARNGSVPSIESIFYSQDVLQPHLSLFTYSNATLNQLSAWENFYLNYLKSNPNPEVEPLMSDREAEALINQAVDEIQVIDEYKGINEVSGIDGKYYTLPDDRILRQYYSPTGVYKYEYVNSIPEERIGGAKENGSAIKSTVSTVLDFIPVVSNIKGAIEASVGEDIITGREIGNVERGILVAAIFGGPIVKGVQKLGKAAMSQLPKVKNVLNPDKAKSFAKDLYDDYIKKGIHSGYSAVNGLVKKIADMPMPLSPKLAIANGMSVTKTIGESMTEAKEMIVQMAGKVKGNVSGKESVSIGGVKTVVDKGQQFTNGRKNRLKSNIRYQIGEYDYFYETDHVGRIVKFETKSLQLTERKNRLSHSKNTPGKVKGQDHAGHLAGDRFGGSPKIDNLVSQLSDVNLKQYKKIEDGWAVALKETPPKEVTVDVEIIYSGNDMRPEKFKVKYTIDGEWNEEVLLN